MTNHSFVHFHESLDTLERLHKFNSDISLIISALSLILQVTLLLTICSIEFKELIELVPVFLRILFLCPPALLVDVLPELLTPPCLLLLAPLCIGPTHGLSPLIRLVHALVLVVTIHRGPRSRTLTREVHVVELRPPETHLLVIHLLLR
jgi:hypothetical protein